MKIFCLLLCLFVVSVNAEEKSLEKFDVKGKFSFKSEKEVFILSFTWHQEGEYYRINLSGPMHSFQARIEGTDDFATLKASTLKQDLPSYSPNTLFEDYFGISFPVLNLKHWIQANLSPDFPGEMKGKKGKKDFTIDQNGWNLRYTDFTVLGDYTLPKKLHAKSEIAKIKMILKEWRLTK